MLSKHLRIAQCDTLAEFGLACIQADRIDPVLDLMQEIDDLYAWSTNVASDIMNEKTTPLTEHLISLPGRLHLIRDTERSSVDSLWIAAADLPSERGRLMDALSFRGLIHNFRVGAEKSLIMAIQISSCQA